MVEDPGDGLGRFPETDIASEHSIDSDQALGGIEVKRLLTVLACAAAMQAAVPTPEAYFGFKIGADKKLARWDKIVSYFQTVSTQTDRVKFRNLGPTTNGNPFLLLEISSAEN